MDKYSWTAPELEFIGFKRQDLEEYIQKYPMPPNSYYDTAEIVKQLLLTVHGAMTLEIKENKEVAFIEWLEGLLAYGQ
jgi:hypothetical protein